MWDALADIAEERGTTVHDVLTEISSGYDAPNLSAAVRVFIVEFYRSAPVVGAEQGWQAIVS